MANLPQYRSASSSFPQKKQEKREKWKETTRTQENEIKTVEPIRTSK